MSMHLTRLTVRTGLGAACASVLLISGCATPPSVRLGDEFAAQGQYVKAAEAYVKAARDTESKGTRNEIARKLALVKISISDESVAAAQQMRKDMLSVTVPELERVISMLQSVVELDDSRKKIAREIESYEGEKEKLKAQAKAFCDKATVSAGQCEFEEALRALDQARRIDPSSERLRTTEAAIQKQQADFRQRSARNYLKRAESAMSQEQDFHKAYIYSLCAMKLVPDAPGVFELHQRARDEVKKSLQKYIAISTFDSPATDTDAGKQFSDTLIGHLYQVLPYGINIVEREKIDNLSKEYQDRTGKIADLLGVDLMVSGRVSLFKVDSSVDERTATVKITVSEQPIENPEFSQMVRLHGKDTSKWPTVPPQTINKGDVQLVKYKKGTGRKKGFAKVSVRIFDAHKGTITFVKDYDASVVEKVDFQDEVADAGIKYIPMDLPTDTEMKEAMRKNIVSEIATVVQSAFENREVRFLNQAQHHIQRRENAEALRSLAEGHLYCIEGRIGDDDKTSVEIRKLIDFLAKE